MSHFRYAAQTRQRQAPTTEQMAEREEGALA
jgi:hypothetical protein